jgi:hypothetical protein
MMESKRNRKLFFGLPLVGLQLCLDIFVMYESVTQALTLIEVKPLLINAYISLLVFFFLLSMVSLVMTFVTDPGTVTSTILENLQE